MNDKKIGVLKKAVYNLVKADIEYKKKCIEKYGKYKDDNDLYCSITGKSWEDYLNAGGSRTMINDFLPREDDFGAVNKRISEED